MESVSSGHLLLVINSVLKKLLLDTLQINEIKYEDSIEEIDRWDSMGHMELIIALEKKYSIRVEPADIVRLTSVKAIQDYLEMKNML